MICLMIKTQSFTEFQFNRRVLRFNRSSALPSIDRFIEECVVEIEGPVARPGYTQTQVVIDERKIMKSWWKFDELRLFIHPTSNYSDFCRDRADTIRRSKKPLEYKLLKDNQQALQSASGFFSTAQQPKQNLDALPGPARVKGKMIWSHKTAPELEIEGKGSPIDPDYIAAQRRR
jgi:hypothetical protein